MMNDWASGLRTLVDEALAEVLPEESVPPRALHRAMRYAVFPGGKRMRPLLVFAAALAASRRVSGPACDVERTMRLALPCAVAVELVHAYSLIHDDLPSMDDDDFRRGRPSVHRAFGEAVAILAGDALLPLAFEVLSARGTRDLMGADAALACSSELARAAGSLGMAGGQGLDVIPPGEDANLDFVLRLASLKTGALISASVRCGAIVAGAGERELQALTTFAGLFGLAFQVFDDLEDSGPGRRLSQGARGPERPWAPTFPGVLGPERAREHGGVLLAQARASLSFMSGDSSELLDLAGRLGNPGAAGDPSGRGGLA